ncbi:glycohydrolase toxin TNT-related protein [Celerinatantimonas sp. YJH-8]|uniref:glycohydrolase toxin TNT-related protein n=1 Tax=Celerinatantimonas sp. YJH-8 TaxID=3228714 RepID=UPI0038C564CF
MQKEKRQYDNAGRVVKVGRFTYQYDACGRAVSKTEQKDGFRPQITRFNWDEQDRLTRIELPNGERWRYRYDAFGRRLSKECEQGAQSKKEIQYRYDGAQIVQQILKAANGDALQTTEYIYEPGSFRPVAQVNTNHVHESEQLHYVVTDQAGTPRELCSEDGDIVWRGEQGLWQRHRQQQLKLNVERQFDEAANDPVQCDLRYQGQLEDCESGLYYNLNRYYDADSGQYLSPDPIGMAGGLRPQAYVHNPMDWGDPLGLTEEGCGKVPKGQELQTYWPPKDGALGPVTNEKLQPGTLIDRYGHEGGSYVSPAGTPFKMRALPPTTNEADLHTYRVLKPIDAQTATIAPAFNQMGLGIQHKLADSISNLVKNGYLERVIK